MSIDRISINSPNIDRSQSISRKETDQVRNSNDKPAVSREDSVSLSSKAKEIDRIASAVEQSRVDRLNEVKKALEAGTYHVPADDIARALIDSNKI
jgi:flagellar biosynthesis anti-sigma factor FlgM